MVRGKRSICGFLARRAGRKGICEGKNTGLAVTINRQSLRLTFRWSWLVANPLESPCGDEAHNQKVVAPETAGVLPGFSIFVGSLEGDIEDRTFVGLLLPDARAYGAVTDFVDWLTVRFICRCLIFHDVLFFVFDLLV